VATSALDVDLPEGYARNQSGPAEYPTGKPTTPEKKRRYAEYIRALWDEQEQYASELHRVWTQTLLFLSGRQWWTRVKGTVFRPPRVPSWKEQPVTNLTMAFFRNYLAKALKNRPSWTVIPATTEPDDIHSAELGDDVLEAKWQELRLARTLRSAVSWCIATGNGFLYPYWNSDSGRMTVAEVTMDVPVYDPITGIQTGTEEAQVYLNKRGDPQLLDDGRPDPAAKPVMVDEGEVGVRSLSPYQVRVNPEAENDDDLTWVLVSEIRSLRELARTHPDLVEDITPEGAEVADLDRALSAMGNIMGSQSETALTPEEDRRAEHLDRVLVLHYHEKPSEEYPNGRYWVATKDTLLEDPQPLPEGVWPPIIHLEDVVIPGRYYASSVMEQVVPINRGYNELNAQIREHHNLMAKGKWLVPRGSGIKQGMISNAPGEVIQFNPGFEPRQANIQSLPQTVVEERNRIFSDFEMVSGQHRTSYGKAPPGVSAGVAFLQLQEADDTDLNPFLTMLEDSVAQLAGAILKIIRERYTSERLIYVVGKNKAYQVRSFRGSDLRGVLDVRPQQGSSFPWSKTAQQSMLLTLAAQMPQLFIDPETGQFDTAKFARALPIGGLEVVGQDTDLDVQEAKREEEQFSMLGLEGASREVPTVGFWQNHDVHYLQHVRVLKSANFDEWPEEGQRAFIRHVQETQQAREQKATQMAQMQAMAQGNAPKELYQQGGPDSMANGGPPGAQAPPNLTPEDLANLSPDELAALEGLEANDWIESELSVEDVPPAAREGF
jgi:hypothetical protein